MDNKAQPILKNTNFYIPKVDFHEFTLDNGLRVILSRSDRIPSVVVNIAYHVGAKDEPAGKNGIAHLFEHLLFEGTANTRNGEFDALLQKRGGESNAYTTMDITNYYTVVPANQFEFALWLDSDRMAGFGIEEKSLQIQKDVVAEEKMSMYDNVPYGSLEYESSRRLFKNSSYAKMVIGDLVEINSITLEDIKDFWEKYYRPSNAVLTVAGDIDYSHAEEMVRKYYGGFEKMDKPVRNVYIGDEINRETRDVIFDNVSLPGVFIFYRLPKMGSKENYAMKALIDILSDGESSRFYKKLIHDKNLLTEVESTVYEMEDVSMLSINAYGTRDVEPSIAEEEIYNVMDEVAQGNFTGEEFTKVKNKLETSFSCRRHSIIRLAEKLSTIKTFYDDTDLINTEINFYLNTTREDLMDAAEKYLNKHQRVVLTYLPK